MAVGSSKPPGKTIQVSVTLTLFYSDLFFFVLFYNFILFHSIPFYLLYLQGSRLLTHEDWHDGECQMHQGDAEDACVMSSFRLAWSVCQGTSSMQDVLITPYIAANSIQQKPYIGFRVYRA